MSNQTSWFLRQELFTALHRWPWLLLTALLGAALGWGAASVWPAYTRSTQVVYVGLNAYRAYSDSKFLALARPKYSNLDNYHYWQMSQLSLFILRDEVLQDTLTALSQADAAWAASSPEDLRLALRSEFRSAGEWELLARDDDPLRAAQLLQAWSDASVEHVTRAVAAAQQVAVFDQRLLPMAADLAAMQQRRAQLQAALPRLAAWQTTLAGLPAAEPLSAGERWQLAGLTLAVAGPGAPWPDLLAAQPQDDSLPPEVLAWSERLSGQIAADLDLLPAQIDGLQTQYDQLAVEYSQALAASGSLAPTIAIERVGPPTLEPVRQSSRLALIGALVGLLLGLIADLAQINRRAHAA